MSKVEATSNDSVSKAENKKKVLIFIVCYNAEASIEAVLDRIPKDIWESGDFDAEILTSGIVSFTAERDDELLSIQLSENGPAVVKSVENLILDA